MPTLPQARSLTTRKLAKVELPECFAAATVASAINAQDRKRPAAEQRRAVSKAYRVAAMDRACHLAAVSS